MKPPISLAMIFRLDFLPESSNSPAVRAIPGRPRIDKQ